MRISRFLLASRLDAGALESLRRVLTSYRRGRRNVERVVEPGPMAIVLSQPDAILAGFEAGPAVGLVEVGPALFGLIRLRCPPPQPELESEVVVLVVDRVGHRDEDIRAAARLLHEKTLSWLVAHGSEVTRTVLSQAAREATDSEESELLAEDDTLDVLPVGDSLVRPRWRLLTARLRRAGFAVGAYERRPEDLPSESTMSGFPDPWLHRRLGEKLKAGPVWAPIDLLGLFVRPPGSHSWNLPAGIHLFLPRIAEFARDEGCHPYRMAWFVLLHELTHCHLYCQGAVHWPGELKAIDVEEAFCEAIASLSLRFGIDPFAGVTCPVYPHRWRFSSIRRAKTLYPYSWFPSLLPVLLRIGPERARDGILGIGQEVERAANDPGRRLLLLEDVLEVLEDEASRAVASAIVRSWRRPAADRSSGRRPVSERELGIHLWGACQ